MFKGVEPLLQGYEVLGEGVEDIEFGYAVSGQFCVLLFRAKRNASFNPIIYDTLGSGRFMPTPYKGKKYTLHRLKRMVRFEGAKNIFGSLVVTTKTGIPVKIVFVRNRNKKSECLYLLSTDVSLSDTEIVRIYGNRWSIECFFKSSKSFLKLGTEFQSHNYGAMVSHTTIVFTRYIILEWIRRNHNDQKTYGELFFMFCDDIQDMDLTNAL